MNTRPLASSFGLALLASTAWAQPTLTHTNVYVSGTQGYNGYRIPAIETAPDGSLLAFAEARKYSLADPGFGKQDIDLVLRRSTDGGKTWSPMQLIEDPGELWSAANPATVVDRQTGRVWLLYLRCKPGRNTDTARPGTDDSQILARTSDDSGLTWSEPIDLTKVSRDMSDTQWGTSVVGPGGAIQDRRGRLIAPVWRYKPFGVFALYQRGSRQDLAAGPAGPRWQRRGRKPVGRAGRRADPHGHPPRKRAPPLDGRKH